MDGPSRFDTVVTPVHGVIDFPPLVSTPAGTGPSRAPLVVLARTALIDIFALGVVVALNVVVEWGIRGTALTHSLTNLLVVELAVLLVWVLALTVNGVWASATVGAGSSEYKRIFNVSSATFAVLITVSYLFDANLLPGNVALLIPSLTVSLICSRAISRMWSRQQRKNGHHLSNVLVIGSKTSAPALADHLHRLPHEGYVVAGLCVPTITSASSQPPDQFLAGSEFPVVGDFSDLAAAIGRSHARVVAVAPADDFGPQQIKALAWQLEGTGIRLVVASGLTDVVGSRLHVATVAGLSLVHVTEPQFRGSKLVAKTLLDRLGALLMLIALSPLMAAAAVAIKLEDQGPVFFRQERVGRGGQKFRMWKFRSMTTDAETRLAQLHDGQDTGNGVLFKLKHDPRVTRVGTYLRRFSIDEVPQLLNVLAGSMSLVGPRPPLSAESESYERHVHRRFLVKPGMTGLWQVSGRSDLSWHQSVRLDLYYVENWSLCGDFRIMARTVTAVLARRGAY